MDEITLIRGVLNITQLIALFEWLVNKVHGNKYPRLFDN